MITRTHPFCSVVFTALLGWLPLAVIPTAMATALDIGLSNLSLAFITLTFYTMVGTGEPLSFGSCDSTALPKSCFRGKGP